jgi:CBS domain-containing protein
MWENDIGALPVLDPDGGVVGMLTDRDVCMAAYTRGGTLADHPVSVAMATEVHTCSPSDSAADVEATMQRFQLRRLPVVSGGRLVGVVSLNDLAVAAKKRRKNGVTLQDVGQTLAGICEHRPKMTAAAE